MSWLELAAPGWGAVWQLVLLWAVGALCGWLLPRPSKNNDGAGTAAWLKFASILNSATWRRATITLHGLLIAREVWYHFTCPGTFRRLFSAVLQLLAGKGWHFDFPTSVEPGVVSGTPCDPKAQEHGPDDSWYVTAQDLAFFQAAAEPEVTCPPAPGCGAWELMMDREIPGLLKYTAWRRSLANGKTEYRSLTVSPDATAQEFMDMYLDDDNRPNWDTMIIHHEVLEHGLFAQRQQVARWIRRFPFSFISDREYVIAKRLFTRGDALYGITKAVDHPRAPDNPDVVRADVFYSMWRSRTVECPWGSGKPACQTLLLHHEQMKIPENLARFAVKHGMWGFVRKLSTETPKFVEARRARCAPTEVDPQAYGCGCKPNPPLPQGCGGAGGQQGGSPFGGGMRRAETAMSALSSLTTQSGGGGEGGGMDRAASAELFHRSSTGGLGAGRSRSGRLKGIAAFALASGLAMLVHRSSSCERLPPLSRRVSGSLTNLRSMRRTRTATCLSDTASGIVSRPLTEIDGL